MVMRHFTVMLLRCSEGFERLEQVLRFCSWTEPSAWRRCGALGLGVALLVVLVSCAVCLRLMWHVIEWC
jgi:hypothetical protein